MKHRPDPWYHPRRTLWVASTQLAVILLASVALLAALSLGRFDLTSEIWFQALLAVLVVNATVCTVTRLPRLWRRLRRHPARASGTLAVHLGLFLLLAGLLLSGLAAWRETTPALAAGQTAELAHAPDLRVRCDSLQVLRDHIDDDIGRVRDVRADLTVLAGEASLAQGAVRVGEPLTVHGIGFHLHGYATQPDGELAAIVQVVYDPGFLPAIAGATIGTLGAALALWPGRLPRSRRYRNPAGGEETTDGV